jgi:hypothetical protein
MRICRAESDTLVVAMWKLDRGEAWDGADGPPGFAWVTMGFTAAGAEARFWVAAATWAAG